MSNNNTYRNLDFLKLADAHWNKYMGSITIKENTVKSYNQAIEKFRDFFQNRPFTEKNIKLYSRLSKKNGSMATLRHDLAVLRLFIAYLIQKQILARNWILAIDKSYYLTAEPKQYKITDKNHVQYLVDFADSLAEKNFKSEHKEYVTLRNALIVRLFAETGAKMVEMKWLRWRDFNFPYTNVTIGEEPVKRTLMITRQTKKLIVRYKELSEILDYYCDNFFVSRKRQILSESGLLQAFNRMVKKSGISKKLSPHMLRCLFIKNLIDTKTGLRDIYYQSGLLSCMSLEKYKKASDSK